MAINKVADTPKRKVRQRKLSPTASSLSDVVEELKGLRRDMVVLCRVIIDGQKIQRKQIEQTVKRAEQPGSLSANVQMPSWYDAIFEANREQTAE